MEAKRELINLELDVDICNKLEKVAELNKVSIDEIVDAIIEINILQDRVFEAIDNLEKDIKRLEELYKKYNINIGYIENHEEQ